MQAQQHKNTRNCTVVSDLDELTEEGNMMDEALMSLERKFKKDQKLEAEDVKQAASIAASVQQAIKDGKKKADGLKGLFTL